MTTNPLMLADRKPRAGRVTVDTLHSYAAELNNKRFVIASGKPYFVARRAQPDGIVVHSLDRTP